MGRLQWGVAKADMTPPVGVMLSGYTPRRSEFVEHPLRAEALVCDNGTDAWALITMDVCGLPLSFVNPVRQDLASRTGLKPGAIVVTTTHTHSGPNTYQAGWNDLPEETPYIRSLHRTLVELGAAAWKARAPGELVCGATRAPGLASNRRVQKPDGTWTNEWSDPEGRHTGYFDPAVELLGVRRPDGRLAALLVTYGCHPVCFGIQNTGISGDYVSYLKDALEASGQVETAMFCVSGHANVDPRVCVQKDPEPVRAMGRKLAGIVMEAVPGLMPVAGERIGSAREPWAMTSTWNLSGHFIEFFAHGRRGQPFETEMAALAVGELVLVGMPGETASEYMQILRELSPFRHTLMLSQANDTIGYLPTDAMVREGAYETSVCPAPPVEAAVRDRARALFACLAAGNEGAGTRR